MQDNVPSHDDDRSYVKKAYRIALRALEDSRPGAPEHPKLKEEIVVAIMELAQAGQTDPDQLARYATHRCRGLL